VADFASQAGPFQIRVLEGDLSVAQLQPDQAPGVIQLVGRQNVAGALILEGTHKVVTTWYNGNPVASQQALGPTEKPTTVAGEWNDRFLGDGAAWALMELLDELRVRGVSVEVSWGGAIGGDTGAPVLSGTPVIRQGIVSRAKFEIARVQDIKWEADFEWRSKTQSQAPASLTTAKVNPRQDMNEAVDDAQLSAAMWDEFSQGPAVSTGGIPQQIANGIGQAYEQVASALDSIQAGSAMIVSSVQVPAQAALQMIGACAATVEALGQVEQNLLNMALLFIEVRDSALGLLTLKDDLFTQLLQVDVARERCVDASAGLQESFQPDVIAVVDAPAGTDLRDLALRYYQDPDMWWLIANQNDIDGSAVPAPPDGASDDPGRSIVIPRPANGSSGNLSQQC